MATDPPKGGVDVDVIVFVGGPRDGETMRLSARVGDWISEEWTPTHVYGISSEQDERGYFKAGWSRHNGEAPDGD